MVTIELSTRKNKKIKQTAHLDAARKKVRPINGHLKHITSRDKIHLTFDFWNSCVCDNLNLSNYVFHILYTFLGYKHERNP